VFLLPLYMQIGGERLQAVEYSMAIPAGTTVLDVKESVGVQFGVELSLLATREIYNGRWVMLFSPPPNPQFTYHPSPSPCSARHTLDLYFASASRGWYLQQWLIRAGGLRLPPCFGRWWQQAEIGDDTEDIGNAMHTVELLAVYELPVPLDSDNLLVSVLHRNQRAGQYSESLFGHPIGIVVQPRMRASELHRAVRTQLELVNRSPIISHTWRASGFPP